MDVEYGIPQGSILEPFFVLYIDLSECVTNGSVNMYADDTMIYFAAKTETEIQIKLQSDLKRIPNWMKGNKLVVNYAKNQDNVDWI